MGNQLPLRKMEHSTQFSAHVYCSQTAVCITISLDTEVGLSVGDIVLGYMGTQLPLPERGTVPSVRFMSIVTKKRADG